MSLSEIAIEAYKKKKAEQDKNYNKEADDFYKSALEALKDQFRDDFGTSKVEIVEKHPGSATIMIGNEVKLMIIRSQGIFHFKMIKKCERCGADYVEDVRHIEDIGKFLLEEHHRPVCDDNLRMKEAEKEPSTREKLMSALENYIIELQEQ